MEAFADNTVRSVPPEETDCNPLRVENSRYLTLDRESTLARSRSTISITVSHDGLFFASSHADHTMKVFKLPSGEQIACLEAHSRTPFSVKFHPTRSNIIASGCFGGEARLWNVTTGKCTQCHNFKAAVSCVRFTPDGTLLAITHDRTLSLWDYEVAASSSANVVSTGVNVTDQPSGPEQLVTMTNRLHMVIINQSGNILITGEQNAVEEHFALKLVVSPFNVSEKKLGKPLLTIPRVVAYNEAGVDFSPCGTKLVACISEENEGCKIAIVSLVGQVGMTLYQAPLEMKHVLALTTLKFSPTSSHVLVAFSFRPKSPVLVRARENYWLASGSNGEGQRPLQVSVVDIYRVGRPFEVVRQLHAELATAEDMASHLVDEINTAVFAPLDGVSVVWDSDGTH